MHKTTRLDVKFVTQTTNNDVSLIYPVEKDFNFSEHPLQRETKINVMSNGESYFFYSVTPQLLSQETT